MKRGDGKDRKEDVGSVLGEGPANWNLQALTFVGRVEPSQKGRSRTSRGGGGVLVSRGLFTDWVRSGTTRLPLRRGDRDPGAGEARVSVEGSGEPA